MKNEKAKQESRAETREERSVRNEESGTVKRAILKSVFPFLLSFLPLCVYALTAQIAKVPGSMFFPACALAAGGLCFYFVLLVCDQKALWRYHNEAHKERFIAVFLLGLVVFALSAFLNPVLFFGLPFAVALSLFSGLQQGLCGYFLLLFMQHLLMAEEPAVFLSHAMIGCIGILLFSFLDEAFLFGLPLFSVLTLQTVLLLGMEYMRTGFLTGSDILFVILSLIVSFLLLTVVLKYTSAGMLHKTQDRFGELNDPECSLLTQLKEKNLRAYYHAVHTAHFCEKLADRIGVNASLCKAGGYYHKIGRILGENNLKNTLKVAEENAFPRELVHLLREYGAKNTPLRSKEAAIVLLSDAMVSSVMFLFDKNKDAKLNYEQITNVVFSKQQESGFLDECELSMGELVTIKKCFMEEKLYYDFLR